ncbi:penicillin-binding transpeptidase domain-containing protein [Pseudochryseolinea flava]|uniref:Peptidoglycan glycosyltransferase n=1 Tax=Pseudochryseolinea flava TaxID=2059302 RepID=A0A364Y7X5_9BACT|nr:penicillin-binding transpeptidase domain-containing protein [Pseudochryseolinea flava]RAW03003.1 peptidoglycan glycosyltransferase [Pseudochryseolinea flava]
MNEGRKEIIQIVFVLLGLIFLIKLFSIQVIDGRYKDLARSNAIRTEIQYPVRGLILDRNGKLIVYNQPEYDLLVILREIENFDSARFCQVFDITQAELNVRFKDLYTLIRNKRANEQQPTPFIRQLSHYDLAKIQDNINEFRGFFIQARTTRAYASAAGANALGYVSEISDNQLKKYKDNTVYRAGDYIGQSGIEAYYEEYLRGRRGVKYLMRNKDGVIKGPYDEGRADTVSIPGQNLTSTVDVALQEYGEFLMKGKAGSIIAIEPASGEILSMISGPSYDPNLLSGKNYSENYVLIKNDTNKPLFNRPLMAMYRPGSIFKIAQAMVALQEGVISPETRIRCDRSIINCHGAHTNEDLRGAITNSCNPYFRDVLRRMLMQGKSNNPFDDTRIGLEEWDKHIMSFGFGKRLGIDLPNEKGGMVPSPKYYDRAYGGRPWKFSNIYSIAIGEGENLVVPLQMANFAATIANKGYYITPHLVKSIGTNGQPLPQYLQKHYTTIDSAYFRIARDAMENVVKEGTGKWRASLQDIVVCGKTGTVQNPPLPDHSVFIAFAPKENPKIAIAVYVEYAGQGGRAAASIASLMIEKYLLGGTKRPNIEEYVLKGKFE